MQLTSMIEDGSQNKYQKHEATTFFRVLRKLQDPYLAYLGDAYPD
jgi:hypothetical protein